MSLVHLRAPRRPVDERGFTIIEVLVALTLIAIMMVSVAGIFYSGLRTAGETGHRTAAAAVATRELEGVRALTYSAVGFYADQPGYRATTPDGKPTVTLGSTTPTGFTPLVSPVSTSVVGSLTYTFRRDIAWVNTEGPNSSSTPTTFAEAYKRVTVEVTWTNDSGTHTATQATIIYPGGQSTYSGPGSAATATTTTTTAAGAPVAPVMGTPNAPNVPLGDEIDISWSQSGTVASFVVQWSTDSTFSTGVASSPALAATATTYQITGLSSSTTYHIRMRSFSSGGAASAWSTPVSATTQAASGGPCTIVSLTVSEVDAPNRTTKTYLKNNGDMNTNLNVAVATSGGCGGAFTVRGLFGTTNDPGSPYSLTAGGSTYGAVISSKNQSGWSVGTHTFDVARNGSPISGTQQSFLVCADTNNPSSNANAC